MTVTEPYFERGGVRIFHGDAREILPELGHAQLVLTDPPWEMSRDVVQGCTRAVELWSEVAPLLDADRLLLWLPSHADPRRWLGPLDRWEYLRAVYVRLAVPGYYGRVLMDGEGIHALGEWPLYRPGRTVIPGGLTITYATDRVAWHPARSGVATRWLLKWWSDPSDLVVDPFMGSGTTLVAAQAMGRRAVGIEVEERYCELTARRFDQGLFELPGTVA